MTRDANILAELHRMLSEERERNRESLNDDRLNRPAAENALDLSRAIYIAEVMDLQNKLIVEDVKMAMIEVLIGAIDQVLNADPIGDTERSDDPSDQA